VWAAGNVHLDADHLAQLREARIDVLERRLTTRDLRPPRMNEDPPTVTEPSRKQLASRRLDRDVVRSQCRRSASNQIVEVQNQCP
jgi:hypothetical protein